MTDVYGRDINYMRVSVTDRCNMRCVYCMPEQGVPFMPHEKVLTYEEIIRVCTSAAALGISHIRLTGGEPLVRRGIANLVQGIHEIEGIEEVTMTTNATLLTLYIDDLIMAGLHGVNISLDTMDAVAFQKITRTASLKSVLEAIFMATNRGLKVKVNTVVSREFYNQIKSMVELAKDYPIDVRFIELMPLGYGKLFTPVPSEEILQCLEVNYGNLTPDFSKLGNGPAQYYQIDGFKGKVGFISSVSDQFCNDCNRIRLTATGFLKLCLHYNKGISLGQLLRAGIDEESLAEVMRNAIWNKPLGHCFDGEHVETEEQNIMSQIGG